MIIVINTNPKGYRIQSKTMPTIGDIEYFDTATELIINKLIDTMGMKQLIPTDA